MSKTNCGICSEKLTFWNQPLFMSLDLTSGERICSSCFKRINRKSPQFAFNIKKYSLQEVNSLLNTPKQESIPQNKELQFKVLDKNGDSSDDSNDLSDLKKKYPKWYGNGDTRGICFESERIEPLLGNKTEIVRYKSNRYAELFGRGNFCSYFPGYGKIYNRTFEVWYREVGSKEKLGLSIYKDIGNDKYLGPFFTERITKGLPITNKLERTLGYIALYNVRDDKNNKTWYAGLKETEFIGIITAKEED